MFHTCSTTPISLPNWIGFKEHFRFFSPSLSPSSLPFLHHLLHFRIEMKLAPQPNSKYGTVWYCFCVSQSAFKMLLVRGFCDYRRPQYATLNMPLWHKDYFDQIILRTSRHRVISENSTSYFFVREMCT